ncbi:MAG TPA: hypothetical protein VLF87_01175 [Patescibacteria group bacterium]|nr:hypothetical protein [Patescibacteria group bacterium]
MIEIEGCPGLGPDCLPNCSLLPEGMTIEERVSFLQKVTADVAIQSFCNNPTAGQAKPICHQREVMKQALVAGLRANELRGGLAFIPEPDPVTEPELEFSEVEVAQLLLKDSLWQRETSLESSERI